MKLRLVTALTVAFFLLPGCKHEETHDHSSHEHGTTTGDAEHEPGKAAAASVNSKCPMMGDPVDPEVTVSYAGKNVGFCCSDCIGEWNKLGDAEKATRLAKSK